MEFFEKAHAVKNKYVPKKETKTGDKIKKQLKQMLYGYKKSDNELIRKSENVIDDYDSASVSSFSDLDLTSSDNGTTKATLDSSDLDSLSNLTEDGADSSKISLVEEISLNKDSSELTAVDDLISDGKNEKETSSDALEEDTSLLLSGDLLSLCTSDESESSKSSLFDVDGALASKIHERLKNIKNEPKDKSKRKYTENINVTEDEQGSGDEHLPSAKDKHVLQTKRSKKVSHISERITGFVISDQELMKNENILFHRNNSLDSIIPSPPFVSIKAKNISSQNLNDIIGQYRYATIKNITSDQSNITLSNFNSTNDWKVEDVNLQEDKDEVNSLDPELGTEINVNDIEIDLTDSDNSSQPHNESFTINNDTVESEEITEMNNLNESIPNSSENPQIFCGENCYIVILKHPSNLFIHGKVIIKRLGGTAQIYGYNLQDKPCEVYAPFHNFAQCIRTVECNNDYYGLFNKLTTNGLSVAEAEGIVTTLGSYDVIVALEKLQSIKMDFVENNFNVTNLFSRSNENIEDRLKRASEDLCCSLYSSQPYKHLEESPNWQQAVNFGFNDRSRGIVCGGKGAGKSTFLRYYVNQLLSQGPVLVVDLDPGQCEFTVAGNISATIVKEPLLGPNFTHLKKPEIMLNVGMISTMDNTRRYISAVDSLITRCSNDERLSNMPWIVNTMGMCNAIGLKFMCFIILRTQPTFLLQIELQALRKNFEFRLIPQKIEELYEEFKNDRLFAQLSRPDQLLYSYIISPAETYRVNTHMETHNFSLAPRDERYLNILAYFGELLHVQKCNNLLEVTPYSVRLQDLFVVTNIKTQKESITKVLNGKVVALCQQTQCDKTAKVFTLGDKPMLSHGHGLIRGVDWEKDVIYVITPILPNDLALVDTILYCDWVPELRGQEKNLPEGTVIPYRTQSQFQQRQLMFAPRRRFNPLQLLKMSRNS